MASTIAVLGGGAWGTALASVAAQSGASVRLWARDSETAKAISNGSNPQKLPGVTLARGIDGYDRFAPVLADADCVVLAIPAQSVREVLGKAAAHLRSGVPVAIAAKGIERGSLKRMTEVLAEVAPSVRPCVLSGPTFAAEVARGLPTAITLAGTDTEAVAIVQAALGAGTLRAYSSDDPIGAEIGGAIKNVIALAAGIATGRGLGENARAALVSRGLAEMIRLAVALGGKAETLMGLAGAGDLILTAMSATSRNTSFGIAIGEGQSARQVLSKRRSVTEGYWTTQAAIALAERAGVEMPIAKAVQAILDEKQDVDTAIRHLLDRPAGAEFGVF